MTTLASSNGGKQQQFYKVTADVAKEHYKLRLITAEGYIFTLLNIHGKRGWKWTFDPKEFCKEFEISKSTFYRAINNLKNKWLVECQIQRLITLCCPVDEVSPKLGTEHVDNSRIDEVSPKLETETFISNPKPETGSPTNETGSPTNETSSPTNETVVPSLRLEKAESVDVQDFQNSPDLSICSDSISEHMDNTPSPQCDPPVEGEVAAAAVTEEEKSEEVVVVEECAMNADEERKKAATFVLSLKNKNKNKKFVPDIPAICTYFKETQQHPPRYVVETGY